MREQGKQGRQGEQGKKNYDIDQCPIPNTQYPIPNNYFVFLILFNCDAKIFKVFANLYYLI